MFFSQFTFIRNGNIFYLESYGNKKRSLESNITFSFYLFFFRQVEKLEANGLESKENLSEESKSSSTNSLDKIGSACTTPTSVSSPASGTSTTDGGVRVNSLYMKC